MYNLDRIRVAGYRSIRDQTVELRQLNLLIGANGSGKSNFVGVFRLIREIIQGQLQLFTAQMGGASRLLYFGPKVTSMVNVHLWFGRDQYLFDLVPAAGDSLVFGKEVLVTEGGELPWTNPLGSGHKETALFGMHSSELNLADLIIEELREWKVYHFHDTSDSSRIKQTADLHDNVLLRPDGGNLAAFLYRLQETQPEVFRNLNDTIKMVAPFFGSFVLRPDRLNREKIKLEWEERDSETYFDAHALSDGSLRFICLATLLLQPELPSLLLLDEPELGLHPYAIRILADLLRSAATRSQVIVSTQSVTLVNQFGPEDILVVDREDGASVFRRLSSQEIESWLDDYSLGELWEKNVLGGRPGA